MQSQIPVRLWCQMSWISLDFLYYSSFPLLQLTYMGFSRESAEQALKVFKGNIHVASQTLAHYGGVLPPSLLVSSEGSSPSEESASSKDLLTESAGENVASSRVGRKGKAVLVFVGNS